MNLTTWWHCPSGIFPDVVDLVELMVRAPAVVGDMLLLSHDGIPRDAMVR